MTKIQNEQPIRFRILENLDFEFVSDFDIRISNFKELWLEQFLYGSVL